MNPENPAVAVTILPAEPKRVEIVPEILLAKTFRQSHGLTGADASRHYGWMVLPKQVFISPGLLEDMPLPPDVAKWEAATRGRGPAEVKLFADLDQDGLTLWEEWVLGISKNTLFSTQAMDTGKLRLQYTENLASGATRVLEVGDGKSSWRAAVEGVDYKPNDLGGGAREIKYKMFGADIRIRQLMNQNDSNSGFGFMRVRLSQDF